MFGGEYFPRRVERGQYATAFSDMRRRERQSMAIWSIRYYIDPETNLPHIYAHEIDESEVEDVMRKPGEDRQGYEGSRVAMGQTKTGRYLRVIYVLDPEPSSVFVITAYELRGKALAAYRRRRRRK